ncbi:MAG: aldo/keto reductase [Candidatus Obscuribacterales bacterium]|nr:aldo/keto reductase [Candidatus Obscuribacterales bacterium]
MDYVKFGKTGLDVSRVCLGCMSFGASDKWIHPWTLNEEESRKIIKHALDLGINFFDTANVYSLGSSEEFTGRAIKDFAKREEIVLATKVNGKMHDGPNGQGLSRKAIMQELDASLKRLGTDYVDLYQIHRWDYNTPIAETMEALHDLVKAGKVRYIGASSMHAFQFAQSLHVAERNGWTRFVSMQNYVNLIYREEEREMLPLCASEGIAVMPWSPLARGKLTRDWNAETERSKTDEFGKKLFANQSDSDKAIVERVAEIAKKHNVSCAQVALAWVLQKTNVVSPIVGATKLQHVDDAVAALALKLSDDEIKSLEEPYIPRAVQGFS